MIRKQKMIYAEEEKTEEETDEQEGEPFAIEDEEALIGLVGDITEASAQYISMMLLTLNGGGIVRPEVPEEKEEDVEFFISSGGGSVSEMFTI